MQIPNKNLKLEKEKSDKSGLNGYFLMNSADCSTVISITIEPAVIHDSPGKFRDSYKLFPKLEKVATNIIKKDYPDYATNEYFVPSSNNDSPNQKHVNAHFVQNGFWIDLHISKVQFQEIEQPCFDELISSVRFLPKNPKDIKVTSLDFLLMGSISFYQELYPPAIWFYKRALESESRSPQLTKDYYRSLIDNLGMAYSLSGKYSSAEELFLKEIPNDPTYPMYYYNLACNYAELEDLESTLAYLQRAIDNQENMIDGEQFPDLQNDSSFKYFLSDKRFIEFIEKNRRK